MGGATTETVPVICNNTGVIICNNTGACNLSLDLLFFIFKFVHAGVSGCQWCNSRDSGPKRGKEGGGFFLSFFLF